MNGRIGLLEDRSTRIVVYLYEKQDNTISIKRLAKLITCMIDQKPYFWGELNYIIASHEVEIEGRDLKHTFELKETYG